MAVTEEDRAPTGSLHETEGSDELVLPDTPAGRETNWLLEILTHILEKGFEGLTEEDFAPHWAPPPKPRPPMDPETRRQRWINSARRLGGARIERIEELSPFELNTFLEARGKRWRNELKTEPEPPHRISWWGFWPTLPEGVVVREATEADGPGLAEIERKTPIVLGETELTFDRADDYFAFARLMEDSTFIVAEIDGVLAGVMAGSLHRARIDGKEYRLAYAHHLRILPEFQRKGVWGYLSPLFWEKYPMDQRIDCAYGYVALDNARMQESWKTQPNKWPIGPVRALVSCEGLAGPLKGRPAGPEDAPTIVEMLNSLHEHEEMYLPYTVESFSAKLERDPAQYSWERILLKDRAVVGVWPAGDRMKVIVESNGSRTDSRRGLVLDYAYLPGGEKDFEALIRAQCARGVRRGLTDLSIFTHVNSPGYEVLEPLARRMEPYDFWTPQIPVPDEAAQRGLYVDQIYF